MSPSFSFGSVHLRRSHPQPSRGFFEAPLFKAKGARGEGSQDGYQYTPHKKI